MFLYMVVSFKKKTSYLDIATHKTYPRLATSDVCVCTATRRQLHVEATFDRQNTTEYLVVST